MFTSNHYIDSFYSLELKAPITWVKDDLKDIGDDREEES